MKWHIFHGRSDLTKMIGNGVSHLPRDVCLSHSECLDKACYIYSECLYTVFGNVTPTHRDLLNFKQTDWTWCVSSIQRELFILPTVADGMSLLPVLIRPEIQRLPRVTLDPRHDLTRILVTTTHKEQT